MIIPESQGHLLAEPIDNEDGTKSMVLRTIIGWKVDGCEPGVFLSFPVVAIENTSYIDCMGVVDPNGVVTTLGGRLYMSIADYKKHEICGAD